MKRFATFTFTLVLAASLAGCTGESLTTAFEETAVEIPGTNVTGQIVHHPLFGGDEFCKQYGTPAHCNGPKARRAAPGAFASPLFGLASAPNDDILVADAGAGVSVVVDGGARLEIPLPGVTDVAPLGRGSMWALKGLTGSPGSDTGQGLYRASKGQMRLLVDLYAFEAANNPDGANVDSNPFDVASLDGRTALVADAGANTLLRVDNQGAVGVVAVFPSELVSTSNFNELAGCPPEAPLCAIPDPEIPAQAVPTSIAVGADGYYYVGELKGFPAPTDASNVWRIDPDAENAQCGIDPACTKVFDGGFTSIIDLVFGPDGRLYVVEFDESSWAAVEIFGTGAGGTINACDLEAGTCEEVATGIPILTAVAFGEGGALWATRNALIPGLADVFQVP